VRQVALEVLIHGPLARTELAQRLGMSTGSLTRLTRPLVDRGLLVELAGQQGALGRPSRPLDVIADSQHFIGMNVSAGEVHAVLTDLRCTPIADVTAPLDGTEPHRVIPLLASLVRQLVDPERTVDAVGVTLGGQVSADEVVRHAPFLQWNDVPLAAELTAATGLPTVVGNDLAARTEAEHWFGAGRGLSRFAVVTVGVGVGYGLVVHDRLVQGPNSGIGVLGHFPTGRQGRYCELGHSGCAAAVLSSGGIAAAVSAALSREVDFVQALQLAEQGQPAASRVLEDAGRALGLLVTSIASLTMAEKVILSGEGIALLDVAGTAMRAAIAEARDPRADEVAIEVLPVDYGAWARGAATLALQSVVLGGTER
jgi:predicted NBD/HSP70 family sugar kinase